MRQVHGVVTFLTVMTILLTMTIVAAAQEQSVLSEVDHPVGLYVDPEGNIFFSEFALEGGIKRLTTDGDLVTIAEDLESITGVVADGKGNLYFLESSMGTLSRMRTTGGASEVIIGDLRGPWGLTISAGGDIFLSERTVNGSIIKVDVESRSKTIMADNLNVPQGIAVDNFGNVYFVEFGGSLPGTLKKIPADSFVPTPVLTNLTNPYAVAVDDEGNIFFTEKTGNLSQLAPDETAPTVLLSGIGRAYGLALSSEGDLYLAKFGSPLARNAGELVRLPAVGGPSAKPTSHGTETMNSGSVEERAIPIELVMLLGIIVLVFVPVASFLRGRSKRLDKRSQDKSRSQNSTSFIAGVNKR